MVGSRRSGTSGAINAVCDYDSPGAFAASAALCGVGGAGRGGGAKPERSISAILETRSMQAMSDHLDLDGLRHR